MWREGDRGKVCGFPPPMWTDHYVWILSKGQQGAIQGVSVGRRGQDFTCFKIHPAAR